MFIPNGYGGMIKTNYGETIGKQSYAEPSYSHPENVLQMHRKMNKTINKNPSFKINYDTYRMEAFTDKHDPKKQEAFRVMQQNMKENRAMLEHFNARKELRSAESYSNPHGALMSSKKARNRERFQQLKESLAYPDGRDPDLRVEDGYVDEDDCKVISLNTVQDGAERHTYETYFQILKSRALAVMNFCMENSAYQVWKDNWKFLKSNIVNKNKLNFELLTRSDQDIAYVIEKGERICFRIHDKERYMPVNIYQYVLYHEMAHMSTHELQHTPTFHKLLNLLSLAAYELGLIDLKRISKSIYTTNGAAILSAESLQDEILLGCNWMIKEHAKDEALCNFYRDLREHVARQV